MLGQMRRPRSNLRAPLPARPRRPATALALALLAAAGALSACGANHPGSAPPPSGRGKAAATTPARPRAGTPAPGPAVTGREGREGTGRLRVVVSAYALAQLVSYVGGNAVEVTDLAPPGVPPQDVSLSAAQRALLHSAGAVIDVGDGYQPAVEGAARSAPRHLAVLPAISGQARPYEFWLDPGLMAKAAAVVARTLTAADPGRKAQFANGSRDFQSVAASIGADFESTFTQCSRLDFVTADDAFGRMAASFDLTDVAVDKTGVNKAVALVTQRSLPAVFSEVGVGSGPLQQVARAARVAVKSLDPMEVAPAPGTAALSYFAVMEEDLTSLEGPLACDVTGNYS